MLFCPYITFTIVSLCQWNTIASYSKCLLVIRRCLKLYPVSMSVRCDIDLTVIFKSCRTLYCLSIPIPFIMPNRLTGAPYLALRSFARLRPAFTLISFVSRTFPNSQGQEPVGYLSALACYIAELVTLNDGCSSHSIYYCSCTPKTLYCYSLSAEPSCLTRRSSSLAS